jgi:YidC/Oxa1 family membrane protein insertase
VKFIPCYLYVIICKQGGPVEEASSTGSDKKPPSYSGKKGKRSKRKRMVQ